MIEHTVSAAPHDSGRNGARRNKSRPVVAALLAVLAVSGIAAASTSSGWADNVLFTTDAHSTTSGVSAHAAP